MNDIFSSLDKNIVLEMSNIHKRFPGVYALKGVNLKLISGEVHALVGENGAGKSTMMKILTRIYKQDQGNIIYLGKKVNFGNTKMAQDAGISIVHQELNLMNHLTAAQNIFIGREGKDFFIDDDIINEKTQKLFDILNLKINPNEIVGNLTVGKQQMIEIARAISFDAKILILDEPTAALTDVEILELFKVMNKLRKQGVAMVYVSHRMDEIMKMSDRITVMRDGEYIKTLITKETNLDEIIKAMVGRTIFEKPKTKNLVHKDAPVILEAVNICSKDVKNVSLQLQRGEILGISGLMGSGRTELVRLIFGADKKYSGTIKINNKIVEINNPKDAVDNGIGYLSEDRKRFGLAVNLSVQENIILSNINKFSKNGFIQENLVLNTTNEYIKKINIKTPSATQLIKNLSGGNQQKVIIGKWLIKNCDILIFDEPTRGIDIGAKNEIYKLMNELVKQNKAIIMISSELPEILRMSDRIMVMCEGRHTKTFDISEASQENIMKYATLRN